MAECDTLTDDERFWIQRFHGCSHIDKALRIIDQHAADRAALVAQLEAANALLARAQDGRSKRPRVACNDQVQLDYDIGQHLQRQGWQWDAINRQWRKPASERVDNGTESWTEYRGREM